jgi:arsenate reductase
MAEAILRHLSNSEIHVESAGTHPQSDVHPMARIAVRNLFNIDMTGHCPKSVDQFVRDHFDYVITVCDQAAETCPVFPGAAERIHWSYEDPAAVVGTNEQRQRAFDSVAQQLTARMRLWLALPEVRNRIAR